MYSFFLCASWQKRQKNARSVLLLPSLPFAVCCEKPATKKNVKSSNAKKRARFFNSYQYVVQFEKTRQKEWGMWSARASLFFFPSYQYVVQFPPKRVTYKGRSTALSFIIVFKCKNGGVPELSLVGQAVWRRQHPIRQFLSSKPNGAKFLKKTKCKVKSQNPWHNGFML